MYIQLVKSYEVWIICYYFDFLACLCNINDLLRIKKNDQEFFYYYYVLLMIPTNCINQVHIQIVRKTIMAIQKWVRTHEHQYNF